MSNHGHLYRTIFTPFMVILFGTLAGTLLTVHLFYAGLAVSAQTQRMSDAADLIAHGGFPLTPEVIGIFSRLLRAQVWLIDTDGRVEPRPPVGPLVAALIQKIQWQQGGRGTATDSAPVSQGSLLAVTRTLTATRHPRGGIVAVIADMSEWQSTLRRAAAWLAVGALAAALGLAVVAHRISRGIADPICSLSAMAAGIAGGDRQVRSRVARDDEIGELAESLNQMAERLASYEAGLAASTRASARGEMAARVAHEIRNPLTAIKMHLEMLGEDLAGTAHQPVVAELLEETRRLELIVSATLSQGRDLPPVLEPASLNDLIADLGHLLAPQLTHRGIALALDLAAGLSLARLDRNKTKQVLLNLLLNAADALPHGGRIQIRTRQTAADANGEALLELHLDDDGPGLDPAVGARLLDDASEPPSGAGIGLRLSRDLMLQQDGGIGLAHSRLGGTCLRVWFRTHPTA